MFRLVDREISPNSPQLSEREIRKRKFLSEYFKLRKQNDSPIYCRQIAAKRIKVSLPTAKRYYKIGELEKLYQQFT